MLPNKLIKYGGRFGHETNTSLSWLVIHLSPLRQKSNVLVASHIFREACCKFQPRREIEHTAIDLIEIDKHSFIFSLG